MTVLKLVQEERIDGLCVLLYLYKHVKKWKGSFAHENWVGAPDDNN